MRSIFLLLLFVSSQFVKAWSQSIDQIQETEVLVIGGTASGICAGLQSSRLGVKTIIAESTPWLGGMLTAAGVSAFDGNHNMPAGIFGEFRARLYQHYGGSNKVSTGWVSNTLFEPHIGDSIFKAMAKSEKYLQIHYHYELLKVNKEGNAITGVLFYDNQQQKNILIKAKRYIDATELGDVLASAKIPYDLGMESNDVTKEQVNKNGANDIVQDITYVAVLKDYGTPQPFIERPKNYDSLEFDASNLSFYKDSARTKPPVDAIKMLNYGKLPGNKYMLNWPIYGNDIYLNVVEKTPKERAALLEIAKQQTLRFVYFIQKDLGFKNLALADDEFKTKDKLAYYPYYRESRRVKGLSRMVVQHIATPFETDKPLYRTGIAVGDYPIDHHHKKNPSAPQHLDFFSVPSYNIPISVLIPENQDNIIIAEKSISVSNVVNGTTRLQPCVMQIGQAAGLLAAQSVKDNIAPKNVAVRKLQNILLDANGYIMPYVDIKQSSPYFKAVQRIGATGLLKGVGVPNGWANTTYFYPDKLVSFSDFVSTWKMKFDYQSKLIEHDMTIEDAANFAAILSGKKIDEILPSFKTHWNTLSLTDFDLKRSIKRVELAAILNEYDLFNQFNVDVFGFYIK
ncbi:MAG: hypothetical protein RIQ51_1694 [Bacteroidota bacterium]